MLIAIILSSLVTAAFVSQHYEEKIGDIRNAAIDAVELYSDTCAESSSGYEDMSGSEAHYEGVKCASEMVLSTMDLFPVGSEIAKER